MGRGCPLCPRKSDVDLFSNFEGMIVFYTEVLNGTLNLGMPEEQLNGSHVRRYILDFDSHHITTPQLAVNCQIKQRKVALASFKLQFGSD